MPITPSLAQRALAVLTTSVAFTAFDLVWLGIVARSFYDDALGPLKRTTIHWPAAALFYVFYMGAIVGLAVAPAIDTGDAAKRGAILGFVAYATYELTNWAVIQNWPARLVPVDLLWGVALTAAAATVGRLVWAW